MSHYSKQRRLTRKVVAVTASNLLTGHSYCPPTLGRSEYVPVSGTWFANTKENPARINFEVPEYGKLLDIRAWVEFISDNRTVLGTGSNERELLPGIGSVCLALRSPNVDFKFAHPVWNSPAAPATTETANNPTPLIDAEIYRSSFLLWDGALVHDFNDTHPAGFDVDNNCWDNDLDMRVIFTDSSHQRNTRHQELIYPNARGDDPGLTSGSDIGVDGDPGIIDCRALTGSAPWAVIFTSDNYPDIYNETSLNGGRISWIYDQRISNPGITGSTNFTGSLGFSPPPGWLTGNGGTAAVNEFPTTGSQVGPATMLPVYPFLEDIVMRNIGEEETAIRADAKLTGQRPGLRGSEVHGRWTLMIGGASGTLPGSTTAYNGVIWFRQARLELLYDAGEGLTVYPQMDRRYRKVGCVPAKEGLRRRTIHLATAAWDRRTSYVFVNQAGEYGRTVGITDHTGSSIDSFSVFTQITGTFSASLSDDQFRNVQSMYLNNEFGTPYIPLSSGSGISPSFQPFTSQDTQKSADIIGSVLRPLSPLFGSNILKSVLGRTDFFKTRSEQVIAQIELSASQGAGHF